jgi:hypothetical protein
MKILEKNPKQKEKELTEKEGKILFEDFKEKQIEEIKKMPGFRFILELQDIEIDAEKDITTLPNLSLEEMGKMVLISKEVVARLSKFRNKLK